MRKITNIPVRSWILAFLLCCWAPILTHAQANAEADANKDQAKQKKDSNEQEGGAALEGRFGLSNSLEEDPDIKAKRKEQYKLELENSLLRLRVERELASLRTEIEKLRVQKELTALQWDLEQEKNIKQYQKTIQELNQQRDKILAELSLSQAKFSQKLDEFNKKYAETQNQLGLARAGVEQLRVEIDITKAQKERSMYADGAAVYLDDPLQKDGTLVLSDRVIGLTGVINNWKARHIEDRINYFNNKDSHKPIFLVIDSSPGGSSHAGLVILQAMQHSKAPIYVVVKAYAASMAALITTLAQKSYIYSDATMLHHQPWTVLWGNLREIKEVLDYMQELWKRWGGAVAKKMKIGLDDFNKKLYEKSARGNWMEFGDAAAKLKWADQVITHIDDTGVRQMPNPEDYTWEKYYNEYYGLAGENLHADGTVFLPQLSGNDFYYLYNPDNLYKIAPPK